MSTASEIDVRINHRNWLARLFGKDEFRLEIDLPHNMVAAADAKTVQGAWNGAVLSAKWFAGVKIVSECPFDEAGNLILDTADSP